MNSYFSLILLIRRDIVYRPVSSQFIPVQGGPQLGRADIHYSSMVQYRYRTSTVQAIEEASEEDDRGRGRKEVRSYGGSARWTRHSISYSI